MGKAACLLKHSQINAVGAEMEKRQMGFPNFTRWLDGQTEATEQQHAYTPPPTKEITPFDTWREEIHQLWITEGFRAKGRIDDQLAYFRQLFEDDCTPEEAFSLFKIADAEVYARHQEAIEGGAALLGLKKSDLNKFIHWSTSRYNALKKADVVQYAYESIALGEDVTVYTTGTYTEASGGSGWNYLVNGPEHYIARGYGESVEHFREEERLQFSEQQMAAMVAARREEAGR